MTGNLNPHEPGRTAEVAEDRGHDLAAALIMTEANDDKGGTDRVLSMFRPTASGIGLEARAALTVLAGIAARSDPRLVRAMTGHVLTPPKRKSAPRRKAA